MHLFAVFVLVSVRISGCCCVAHLIISLLQSKSQAESAAVTTYAFGFYIVALFALLLGLRPLAMWDSVFRDPNHLLVVSAFVEQIA